MAWAIAGRGGIYRLMRRYDEALADLTRVLSLAPDREDIREDIRAELEDIRAELEDLRRRRGK